MPTLTKWPALLGCCGVLLAPALQLSHAGETDVPATTASHRTQNHNGSQPLNLARAHLGAQLDVLSSAGAADVAAASAALLHDDDPLGYPVAEGNTSIIVTLPKIEVLNRFNFLNLTAAGKITVSISSTRPSSTDNSGWRQVQGPLVFSGSDVFTCELGSVEARYVKVDFEIEKSGRIDTFGLFGARTLNTQDGARMAASDKAGADKRLLFNYAVSSSQAGVIMVSPGEDINRAQALADGDVGSSFAFKSTDAEPMAVIDLGDTRTLNRVSTSFKAGPGHMDIYLVKDPAQEGVERVGNNGSKARTLQQVIASDFPAGRQPILSTDTGKQPGLTRVSANAGGQAGRYLIMVFHPAGGTVNASAQVAAVDYKDFKDARDYKDAAPAPVATAGGTPLEVAEITAFGDTPPGAYAQQLTPNFPGTTTNIFPPGTGTNVPNTPPIFPPSAGGNAITP